MCEGVARVWQCQSDETPAVLGRALDGTQRHQPRGYRPDGFFMVSAGPFGPTGPIGTASLLAARFSASGDHAVMVGVHAVECRQRARAPASVRLSLPS